jgi:hypothetical protein
MDMHDKKEKKDQNIILLVLLVALTLLLMGIIVKLSWNYVMPHIVSGVGKITFLQALVLVILTRTLFSNY